MQKYGISLNYPALSLFSILYWPLGGVDFAFYFFLIAREEGWEEVETGEFFDIIDIKGIFHHCFFAFLVGNHEADGDILLWRVHDFIKTNRDGDFAETDLFDAVAGKQRAGYHV